tara:strand:+ start:1382 stop:2023 length:642 start_codon:yes stop_codon:yes gene_type:complete
MKKEDLPSEIAIFPLSNFIIFPQTNVPLNIFEPRYIQMIDDAMKGNRMIGIIQPKKSGDLKKPDLYDVGCAGKITSFNETEDGRYLIVLNGICRFKIISEEKNDKIYRICNINFTEYLEDLNKKKEDINFTDLKFIFKELKSFFKKQGYLINLDEINKRNLDHAINTISMVSPFSLEEKQILLESRNLKVRKEKLEEIIKIYTLDNFSNTTLQ